MPQTIPEHYIKLTHKEVLAELNAQELAQNKGSDAGNVETKGKQVAQSVGMVE